MATITLKGIDDQLLDRLKKMAKSNRRSLNQEIIFRLEELVPTRPLNFEEVMELVEKTRPRMKGKLSEEEIDQAIKEGRE